MEHTIFLILCLASVLVLCGRFTRKARAVTRSKKPSTRSERIIYRPSLMKMSNLQ